MKRLKLILETKNGRKNKNFKSLTFILKKRGVGMKRKYDVKLLNYMRFFEKITRTQVKDCIDDDNRIIFIVDQLQLRRAIGKNGSNVKKLERELNKKIKIVEYNPQIKEFVKSLIMPLRADEIIEEEGIVKIKSDDRKTKGLLIGKNGRNLRKYEEIIKRYFDIKELRVE